MNTVLHIVLIGLGVLAPWLVLGLGVALIIGRTVRLADEIEVGGDGDELGGVSGFSSAPHDIGKSISDGVA